MSCKRTHISGQSVNNIGHIIMSLTSDDVYTNRYESFKHLNLHIRQLTWLSCNRKLFKQRCVK